MIPWKSSQPDRTDTSRPSGAATRPAGLCSGPGHIVVYGNPAFRPFASMVNPPIHIIVERGRVTLEGVVNNNVDRQIANSIASQVLAFEVKNELRTTQEAQAELEKL